jgi:hypothetical protein
VEIEEAQVEGGSCREIVYSLVTNQRWGEDPLATTRQARVALFRPSDSILEFSTLKVYIERRKAFYLLIASWCSDTTKGWLWLNFLRPLRPTSTADKTDQTLILDSACLLTAPSNGFTVCESPRTQMQLNLRGAIVLRHRHTYTSSFNTRAS